MNHDVTTFPQSRSWRDIPQQVRPRAMSREGRWRLATSTLRTLGLATTAVVVSWGVWEIASSLREDPKRMPEVARAVPVKHLSLRTDGVLDGTWLARTLALPKNASLMELDLEQLQARLLAGGQVSGASLTRSFPDTLLVRISERSPVLRLRARFGPTDERLLLAARDGTIFEGACFDPAQLTTLPWLDGVKLTRTAGRFDPIEGMEVVADLMAHAQLETERLYQTWQTVSLARFASDDEIEIRTKTGTTVVFGAKGDLFRQLAKLDYEWDVLANAPTPPVKIDLSLGREVPVTFAPAPVAHGRTNPAKPASSKLKREL